MILRLDHVVVHRVEVEMPPPSVVEKEKCTLCGEL